MKHSKKYLKKMRKRILGFTFSIAMSLMLIAGSRLAEFSIPFNNSELKEYTTNLGEENNEISQVNSENSELSTHAEETLTGIDEIKLNIRQEYIKIGDTLKLTIETNLTSQDSLLNSQFTWTSSNPDVATVDQNGLITGVGIGHATITAYNEATGLKAKAIINVYRNQEGAVTVPQVVYADSFTVVLKEDGTVWSTGKNDEGQLGDGTRTNRNTLEQVKINENTYLTNVKKISVGREWAAALTLEGKIYTWGRNDYGQLSQGDTETLAYAKQAKVDENTYIENIIDIATGEVHLMAVSNTGEVYLGGHNYWYQFLTTGREMTIPYLKNIGLSNTIKVNAGDSNCSALLSNGKALMWGANRCGELETKPNPTLEYVISEDVVDIKLNGYYTIIQKDNGEIYVTGRNGEGQLGLGDNSDRNILTKIELPKDEDGNEQKIKYIEGRQSNIMLMTTDGKIYVSGYNGYGQLCTGNTTNSNTFIPLVNKDGSIVRDALLLGGDGENSFYINSSKGISFIRQDGTIWISGDNTYGQIGNGTNTSTNYLTAMGTSTEVSLNARNEYIKTGETLDLDVLGGTSDFNVFVGADALKSTQTGYTWTSSNPDVATVDANGLVTGTGIGHTTITAYNEETGLKAKAIINVYRNQEGAITVPQAVKGNAFTVILKEDGTVWLAGWNDCGQLGDGTSTLSNILKQVKIDENTYLTNIKKISVGKNHVAALALSGEVYVWGNNDYQKLGQGSAINNYLYATKVKGVNGEGTLENIIDIACGASGTFALNTEGIIFGWGRNNFNQIQSTNKNNVPYPTEVEDLKDAIKITAGVDSIGAICSNGKTFTKGYNAQGQLGGLEESGLFIVGNDIDEIEISGYMGAILREDGTLWTSGYNQFGQLGLGDTTNRSTYTQVKYENGETVKAKVASTNSMSLQFIGEDGKVYVTGYNQYGQLSDGSTTDAKYPIAMKNADGTKVRDAIFLMSQGFDFSYTLNMGLIRTDGTVWMSGDNTYGQLGNGTNINTNYLTAMGTSSEVSLNKRNEYIKTGETLDLDVLGGFEKFNVFAGEDAVSTQTGYTWTSSNPDVATVDANGLITGRGIGHTTITAYNAETGLKAKAIINVYRNVAGAITVPQVASGEGFTVVLKEDGTVWATGVNGSGQLGDGTTTNRNTLEQVKIDENTYLTNIKKISAGYGHVVALTLNGEVYAWGANDSDYGNNKGALGQGDGTNRVYATRVKGVDGVGYIENIIDIACGDYTTFVLNNKGIAFGCGCNLYLDISEYGSVHILTLTQVTKIENMIDITAGNCTVGAICANGEVWVKGLNNYGQLGNGTTSDGQHLIGTDINEFELFSGSGAILKEDGSIWTTGYNNYGQLGVGDTETRTSYTQVIYSNGENAKAKTISAGGRNLQFIGEDGKVYVTGYNGYGELSNGTAENYAPYPMTMKNADGTEVKNCLLLMLGGYNVWQNNPLNLGLIRKDGSIWLSGDNTYGQIGNGTNTSTNYLTPMRYVTMPSLEKIDMQVGEIRTLTEEERTYLQEYVNVFGKGKEETALMEKAEILNTNIATCEGVTIEAKAVGETVLKLEEEKGATFNIPVTVVSDDASLGLVEVNDVLAQPTGENDHVYEVGIPKLAETAKIRVKAKSKYGIVKIGEKEGTASEQTVNVNVSLSEDRITVPVEVTASDGVTVENYTIILIRQSNEAGLNKVVVNGTEIENRNNAYTYYLGEQETSAHVEITAEDATATVKVDEQTGKGYLEFDETIEEGTTKIVKIIKVIAEDGTTEEYTLIISRKTQITGNVQPKVVAGVNHIVALKANGSVWAWGINESGQLGIGNTENQKEPVKVKAELDDGTIEEITDAIDIAAGQYQTLVLRKDGTVWATGYNMYGETGVGTTNIFHKVQLESNGEILENIVAISAGHYSSYALTKEGEVYAWGWNERGQLGIGNTTNQSHPVKMQNVSNIVQISGGGWHMAMLAADGTVWTTGCNTHGQLGIGNTSHSSTPQQMKTEDGTEILYGVKEVSAGDDHTIILKEDGTVWTTGWSIFGQLGRGSEEETHLIKQVKVKEAVEGQEAEYVTDVKHVLALGHSTYISRQKTEDGKNAGMYVMGSNQYGGLFTQDTQDRRLATPVEEGKDILTMTMTKRYNSQTGVIVDEYGNVYTVGYNYYGQLGNGTTRDSIIPICIDPTKLEVTPESITYQNIGENTEIITCNMTLGFNLLKDEEEGKYTFTSNDENVATVDETGRVTAVGKGTTTITVREVDTGIEKEVPVTVNNYEVEFGPKVVGGASYFVALKANGSVWGWGRNANGQLGIGNTENQLEPVKAKAELEDGTIEEITDAIDIAAGQSHTLVLRKDGSVWSAGKNDYGQSGEKATNIFRKVKLNSEGDYLENIVSISAGNQISYALTKEGEVYGWGNNRYAQLGLGYQSDNGIYYPQKMQNVSNIVQISAGAIHVLMLDADGSVWALGNNEYGQLGLGYANERIAIPEQMKTEDGTEILYGVKEIAAGDYYSVILKEDGSVWGTGQNNVGQLGIGTNTRTNLIKQVKVKEAEDGKEAEYVTDAKHIIASGATYISREKSADSKNTGMYVMGANYPNGGLFTQDIQHRYLATPVEESKDILTMAISKESSSWSYGGDAGVIVDEYGNVYTVGDNYYGQLGNGTRTNSIIPICINPTKLEVTPESITYNNVGQNTETITCNMTMGFNLLKDYEEEGKYTFTSNNENIATVDETGRITATGKGTTTITVREIDTGIEKEIPVNVIIETIQKITGQITTENLEGKYKGTVKLYRRKRKDEDVYGDEDEDLLVTETETDEEGKYVLDIDEIGVYDVLITKLGYLSYKIAEIEIKEGAIVEIEQYKLIAGDVAVDGEIEIDDLVDMNRNVGKELTEENAIYDLNEDGKIDMEDRKILKKNYGKKAEETKWVNSDAEIELMNLDIVEDTNLDDVGAGPVSVQETGKITNNAINNNTDALTSNVSPLTSFVLPMNCKYTITSTYGYRIHPTTGENKLHAGIDLVGDHHTEILAVTDGEVTYAGVQNGYGNCIEIKHIVNGETIYSFYAHLSKIKVKVGEKVAKGQVIGLEGGAETDENHGTSTGHHLHFEIRTASGSGHSVDPTKYIEF